MLEIWINWLLNVLSVLSKWFFRNFYCVCYVNYVYIQNVRYNEIDIYMPKYICWPRYRVLIPLSYIKLWRSQTHINYVYLPSYLLIHDKYMYITYIFHTLLFLHFHCHSRKSAFLYIYNTVFCIQFYPVHWVHNAITLNLIQIQTLTLEKSIISIWY